MSLTLWNNSRNVIHLYIATPIFSQLSIHRIMGTNYMT